MNATDAQVEAAAAVLLGRVNAPEQEIYRAARDAIEAALSQAEPAGVAGQEGAHPDDIAVDRFATAMKAKLAKKRAEGRGGWDDKEYCSTKWLSRLLREHVEKGDPLDVGNLAMMLHARGDRIAPPAAGVQAVPVAEYCGGCGETDPAKRCIGCLHPFRAPASPVGEER